MNAAHPANESQREQSEEQPARSPGGVFSTTRSAIRKNKTANRVYRTSVGVAGGGAVALGIILIPLPGPGTVIALGGLALLGTEFEGAKKTSRAANAAAKKAVDKARARRAAKKTAATPADAESAVHETAMR